MSDILTSEFEERYSRFNKQRNPFLCSEPQTAAIFSRSYLSTCLRLESFKIHLISNFLLLKLSFSPPSPPPKDHQPNLGGSHIPSSQWPVSHLHRFNGNKSPCLSRKGQRSTADCRRSICIFIWYLVHDFTIHFSAGYVFFDWRSQMFSFGGWLRGRLVPLCWLRGDVFVLVDFFFLRAVWLKPIFDWPNVNWWKAEAN